jgi:hypothetical protein
MPRQATANRIIKVLAALTSGVDPKRELSEGQPADFAGEHL